MNKTIMRYTLCLLTLLISLTAFADGTNWAVVNASAPWGHRSQHQSVVFKDKIWVLGGYKNSTSHNDVWSSPDGTNWTLITAAAPWAKRIGHECLVFNNKLWLFGGNNPSTYFNDVWFTDDGTNWSQAIGSASWQKRAQFAATLFDGSMWLMGGYGSNSKDVWKSSDGTNWTEVTSDAPWGIRSWHRILAYDNKLWMIGGDFYGHKHNDVWSSPDGTNWTEVTAHAGWTPRGAFGSIVYLGKMWVMSGNAPDVWSSSNGTNWTLVNADVPWGRRSAFGCVIFQNKLLVVGSGTTDVWQTPCIEFSSTGTVSVVNGATGDGTSSSPYDLGSTEQIDNDTATLRLYIEGSNVTELVINRTSGSINFSASGLATSINSGSNADFMITYTANGPIDIPETATFGVSGKSMASISFVVKGITLWQTPKDITASDGTFTNKVLITWNACSNATKYIVYRNTVDNNSGAADISGEVTDTSFDDLTAFVGHTYFYWVKAGYDTGWSDFSISDSGYKQLSVPTGISASDGDYLSKVVITWNLSIGATKYKIYRSTVDNSSSASDISGEIAGTSFEDTTVLSGITYYYWTKAGCDNGWSDFSDSDSGYEQLSVPTDVSASDGGFTDKVKVTWSASTGAIKYKVYRNTVDNSSSASDISGEITGTSFDDTTANPCETYYYWLKAGCDTGWSDFSNSDSGYEQLSVPTDVSANDGGFTDKVKVTWSTSTGATKYKVYRNTVDNSSSASDISGEVTGTSFDDTTANPCETYYYWLKAGCDNGWSDFSISDSGYKQLSVPTGISASDGDYLSKVVITWNLSIGATKYKIYRSTVDNSSSASDISGEIAGTSFEDTTVLSGITYYYWTKAGCDNGWSDFSNSDSGYAKLSIPVNISATDGTFTNRVVITWSVPSGATGYEIYRGISNNPSNAILLASSESNNYSDTSVELATKYYYWVKGTASACNSELSASDSGYAILSSGDDDTHSKWKYKSKNGKAKLIVANMGMTIPLANYLEDGCLIGLKDASNNETVDGPRKLESLIKKKTGEVKKWQYIEKKVAIIKYTPKKDKLIYKIWQDLPAEIIFFVQPPADETQAIGTTEEISEPISEIHLSGGDTQRKGWRMLKSTVIEKD